LKGQTALEYLITYGWAILVILVVLAVLWYYGVFNPSKWQHQCPTILEKYNVSSCDETNSLAPSCQYQNKTCDCSIIDGNLDLKCVVMEEITIPPNA